MQFFTALLSALVLAVSTTATPIHVAERSELIVYSPTITSPTEGAIWPILSQQVVKWSTSGIPRDAQNNTGSILLGYLEDGDDSEHLDYEHPLAEGFFLTAGSQIITVPNVPLKDTYIIAVMGDSGNSSPKISIVHGA
ncbi:hypothetical protein EDB92DRAFT_892011 [Lactarius akahatsu]|uniref:Uncharacterized protein n=1 Tax=Lactarius akahatsu TaxID=416441 RepID=A0AAD4LGZ0_9AGAM|nr:hypothetical protein EDB92DRAFT_892011 [Lactarius akahatsu]